MEGTFFSTHYAPAFATDLSKKFVADYQKRFAGKLPDAMAALGYDSAMLLADAMKRAGTTDGAKVRDALAATKDFPAVAGNITINEKRDAVKAAVILKIEGGKFKFVEMVNP